MLEHPSLPFYNSQLQFIACIVAAEPVLWYIFLLPRLRPRRLAREDGKLRAFLRPLLHPLALFQFSLFFHSFFSLKFFLLDSLPNFHDLLFNTLGD